MRKPFFSYISLTIAGAVLSLILTACATAPPASSTTQDVRNLAGTWEGWGELGDTVTRVHVKMLIREDGKWQMVTSPGYYTYGTFFYGTSFYHEGKFQFSSETPGLNGNFVLKYWGDRAWLQVIANNASIRADLRRLY